MARVNARDRVACHTDESPNHELLRICTVLLDEHSTKFDYGSIEYRINVIVSKSNMQKHVLLLSVN